MLIFVPIVTAFTRKVSAYKVIVIGSFITAASPFVSCAISSTAARLAAMKDGFSSRSSGGYPHTASSGKATMSAPAVRAWLSARRIACTLPSMSPTVAFSWPSPIRILAITCPLEAP